MLNGQAVIQRYNDPYEKLSDNYIYLRQYSAKSLLQLESCVVFRIGHVLDFLSYSCTGTPRGAAAAVGHLVDDCKTAVASSKKTCRGKDRHCC